MAEVERAGDIEELLAHWLAQRVPERLREAFLRPARRLFAALPGGVPHALASRLLVSFDGLSRLPLSEEAEREITESVLAVGEDLVARASEAARRNPEVGAAAAVLVEVVSTGGRARNVSFRPWRPKGKRDVQEARLRRWLPEVAGVRGWVAGPRESLLLLPLLEGTGRCRPVRTKSRGS